MYTTSEHQQLNTPIDYEKLAKELAPTSKISSGILTIPSFAGRMLTARQITAVSQGAINRDMKALHALSPKNHPLKHPKQTYYLINEPVDVRLALVLQHRELILLMPLRPTVSLMPSWGHRRLSC